MKIEQKSKKLIAKKKKAFKMPHGYVVIFMILIFVSIMTYLIPAGQYDRVVNEAGQEVVVAGSFQYIDKTPVPFWLIPNYIMQSFENSADIIFGVLIVGAGLEVLLSTGMFHAFCNRLSKACKAPMHGAPTSVNVGSILWARRQASALSFRSQACLKLSACRCVSCRKVRRISCAASRSSPAKAVSGVRSMPVSRG